MRFEQGNQFWLRRATHGRRKIFATPEIMWAAACEYFQYCEENPLYTVEVAKGKDNFGEMVNVPHPQPFTLKELSLFLHVTHSYYRSFKSTIMAKGEADRTPDDLDFLTVIERIENTIYNQKFKYAAIGVFKENLIARDLGLSDNTNLHATGDGTAAPAPLVVVYNGNMPDLESDENEDIPGSDKK